MENVHMSHATTGGALCGAHQPRCVTNDEAAVTCPLCGAMLDGRAVVQGIVEAVQQRATAKLAEMQRDPAVRALAGFARSVLLADREVRGQRTKRES